MSPFGPQQNVNVSPNNGNQSQNPAQPPVVNNTTTNNGNNQPPKASNVVLPPTANPNQDWNNKMNHGFPQQHSSAPGIAQQQNVKSQAAPPQIPSNNNINSQQQTMQAPTYQNPLNYQKKPEGMPTQQHQESQMYSSNMKPQLPPQQRNMPEMINLGYSGAETPTKSVEQPAPVQKPTVPGTTDLSNKHPSQIQPQIDNNKFLDLSKQQHQNAPPNTMQNPNTISNPPQSQNHSIPANQMAQNQVHSHHPNQQQMSHQSQQLLDFMNYNKSSVDFRGAFDMLNRMNLPGSSKNPSVAPSPSSCSVPNTTNPFGKVDTPGNEYNLSKNNPYMNQGPSKPVEAAKAPTNQVTPTNYSNMHPAATTTKMQGPNEQVKTNADLNIPNLPRYDSPTANMKNSPFSSYDFFNFSAMMRDDRYMALGGTPPSGYYDKNIPHAHMYSKAQTNSTAALQQLFNNSMTTMAYGSTVTNRDQQSMNVNYQNRLAGSMPPVPTQQQNTATSQADVAPKEKQKRPRKSKNPTPTHQNADVATPSNNPIQHQSQQQQMQQQTSNSQSKNPNVQVPMQAQDWSNKMNPNFPQNLVPGSQLNAQQLAAQQQGFQSYSKAAPGVQTSSTESSAISLKTAGILPGSAFNLGPGNGLGLPTTMFDNPTSYLEESRGSENPYYPAYGLRNPREATPSNPYYQSTLGLSSTPKTSEKSAQPPPAHPPPAASPYHQFLPHHGRPSYPHFMNPSIDPLYQQHFQRQDEFNQQMMLNQSYQASYLSMQRPPWL